MLVDSQCLSCPLDDILHWCPCPGLITFPTMLNAEELRNVEAVLDQTEDILVRRELVESCTASSNVQQLFERLCNESGMGMRQLVMELGDYELQALFLDLIRKCNAMDQIGRQFVHQSRVTEWHQCPRGEHRLSIRGTALKSDLGNTGMGYWLDCNKCSLTFLVAEQSAGSEVLFEINYSSIKEYTISSIKEKTWILAILLDKCSFD